MRNTFGKQYSHCCLMIYFFLQPYTHIYIEERNITFSFLRFMGLELGWHNQYIKVSTLTLITALRRLLIPWASVEFEVGVSDATLDAKQLQVRRDSVLGVLCSNFPAQKVPQMLKRVQIGAMGWQWNCGNSVLTWTFNNCTWPLRSSTVIHEYLSS